MRSHFIFALIVLMITSSCASMNISDFDKKQPTLVIENYFQGKTWAWGIFEDRFGRLRREFTVNIDGTWDGETLILDEHFDYSDGEKDRRVWTIKKTSLNQYEGRADDIIGTAQGLANGNALSWRYIMNLPVGDNIWKVTFDDWMFLQPHQKLINRATISKWGIELGTVTLFFSKQAPL